jgi:hypothetical protein
MQRGRTKRKSLEMESYRLKKEVRVIFPFYRQQKPCSIRLKRGLVNVNPHVRVLCPRLAEGKVCRKGITMENKKLHRPKLLLKNHVDPGLQLWICEGCKSKFLLRVETVR